MLPASATPAVATIDLNSGVVTGVGIGTSEITYTVAAATTALSSGSGTWSSSNTATLTATPSGGTWSISNPSVATINATTGELTGVIVFNSVCVSATTTLGSTPGSGIWSSSNTTIATVNSSGVVSGINPGTVSITYTYPIWWHVEFICRRAAEVTVNALPASITGTGVTCAGGGTTALTNVSGTWTSSNTGIATVNYLGTVTGVTAGTFTATPSGGTWTSANPSVFSVDGSSGAMTALIANYTSNSLVSGGTWSSATPAVATIDLNSGVVTGVGIGTSEITYTVAAATTSLSNGSGTWSSSNTGIATVNFLGTVTGVSAGNANITFRATNGYAHGYPLWRHMVCQQPISGYHQCYHRYDGKCTTSGNTHNGHPNGQIYGSGYG
eukprot:gene31064-biopygen24885